MVAVAAIIIIIIGVVFYRSLAAIPFGLGVIVTSILNIYKIRMLERTVQKVINMEDKESAKNVVRLRYLLRYSLTGIVLVAVGLIHNYTSPPPIYSSRESYLGVWAVLFPGAPESLSSAPLISIWGAIFGVFTLQLSVILVRSLKLEKDGDNFIDYVEDDPDNNRKDIDENVVKNDEITTIIRDEKEAEKTETETENSDNDDY